MAKLLVWSLGTGTRPDDRKKGSYRDADYFVDGREPVKTTNIYQALATFYDFDKYVVIGTSGSGWNDLYFNLCSDNDDFDEEYWQELNNWFDKKEHRSDDVIDFRQKLAVLKEHLGERCAEIIILRYGLNDQELFENFEILAEIAKYINDGDSLSFDITHSFRSLAFYELLAVSFFKDVVKKNVDIDFVSYGMLEISGELNGKTPIVNMKPLISILEWIKAAEEYKSFGTAYKLVELLEHDSLGYGLGKEEKKALNRLGDIISGNDITEFKYLVANCNKTVKAIEEKRNNEHAVVGWIFRDISKRFGNKIDDDYLLRFELAKWHFEKKRWFISAITLSETLLDFFADYADLKRDKRTDDNALREILTKAYSENTVVYQQILYYNRIARSLRNSICHGEPLDTKSGETLEVILKHFKTVYEKQFKNNQNNQNDLRRALHKERTNL